MAQGFFNHIVQLNVTAEYAPEPSALQSRGMIVSENSTNIAIGSAVYLGDPNSLSNYLKPSKSISTLTWAAGVVTVALAANHGLVEGSLTPLIVSGAFPDAYNGTYVATAGADNVLTYSLANDPGIASIPGSARYSYDAWLIAADATWWAQPGQVTGYFLFEAGTTATADMFTALDTWLTANPKQIYNICFLPGVSSDAADAYNFFSSYNQLSSLLSFYLPVDETTAITWASYNTLRNVFVQVQALTATTASQVASIAYAAYITNIRPTPTNKLPPSSYAYLNNVDALPLNQTLMSQYIDGNINFASLGAEGGISNIILIYGNTLNGFPENVKYSIDWQQVEMDLSISNAVINGSNNQINPLYYNQDGINRLQAVAANVAARAISTGLALGRVITTQLPPDEFTANLSRGDYRGNYVINAVPFASYVALNPSDYARGLYGGFQASFVPQFGFRRIVFNILATTFP